MAKLSFYHGVMGAGKSEELMKIYRNYTRINKEPVVFSYSADNRFGDDFGVHSRNGDYISAIPFNKDTQFRSGLNIDVIMIDEGQFLTQEQVYTLANLVDNYNTDVLVFGLRTDAFLNFFEGSKTLFEISDKLIELKTLCAFCSNKAIVNGRFVNGKQVYSGSQIQIGDEEYKGLCRKHYMENKENQ